MLLIDGIRYELWTPPSEDDFEQMVKEHTQEIFGEQSIYIDRKQKLKSLSGVGSIPDGYVVCFGSTPQWHIVEMELSSHPLHEHIVAQISKFITGISNPNIQRTIVNALEGEIARDDYLRLKLRKAIEPTETYRFLSDLITKPPVLSIIIEKNTEGVREALSTLNHSQIKVIEFQTFRRVGADAVHAHIFEPLYTISSLVLPTPIHTSDTVHRETGESIEITLQQDEIRATYIHVPRTNKALFPDLKTAIELDTNIGQMKITFNPASWGTRLQGGLSPWFNSHPELRVGDRVRVTVIDPKKKYRLEIVK